MLERDAVDFEVDDGDFRRVCGYRGAKKEHGLERFVYRTLDAIACGGEASRSDPFQARIRSMSIGLEISIGVEAHLAATHVAAGGSVVL